MTIAVDLGRKATKQTNKRYTCIFLDIEFNFKIGIWELQRHNEFSESLLMWAILNYNIYHLVHFMGYRQTVQNKIRFWSGSALFAYRM